MIVLFSLIFIESKEVLISNVKSRLDEDGNIVNSHGGCLVKFNKTYYLYGTVYEECHQSQTTCDHQCGFKNNTFSLYTSEDLDSWKLVNTNILPEMSEDNQRITYWMPNVGFNEETNKYYITYWSSKYAYKSSFVSMAISSNPTGPFKNIEPIEMKGGKLISDTIHLFVDDDNRGYLRYNTVDRPRRHIIERLTSNWMNSSGEYSIIFEKADYPWYDGGGIFKRNGIYYTMLSFDCCFCQWGSDAKIFSSNHLLGNWTYHGQLNYCADGSSPPEHVKDDKTNPCSMNDPYGTNFTVPAHPYNIATLPISSNETIHLYYGERFRSSKDGLKAHDFQTWLPIQFIDVCLQPLYFLDNFTLHVDVDQSI